VPASTRSSEPSADERRFSRWPWWRRWFGRRSERAAARFLRSLGYRVLAANVAHKTGELDILAIHSETLIVVEVRSTSAEGPEAIENTAATVNVRKQRQITNATLRFLAARKLLGKIAVRFDVLVLSWPPHAREPAIKHIPHAFQAVGKFQMFS
jgi:putative endonuclease